MPSNVVQSVDRATGTFLPICSVDSTPGIYLPICAVNKNKNRFFSPTTFLND